MKKVLGSLASVFFFCILTGAQRTKPVPPGVREADKLPNPADVPPQIKPHAKGADPAELKRQADELAKRAQGVPSEINEVTQSRLPKDLPAQLKQIEKLSKQLRREVFPWAKPAPTAHAPKKAGQEPSGPRPE